MTDPIPTKNHDVFIETDALVIGAGTVGLFQVFQLGLLGIKVHVVEAMAHAGGQCMALYPQKFIYDIPAISKISGAQLSTHLLEQSTVFSPEFHYTQTVETLTKHDDNRWFCTTSNGTKFLTKTIFICTGIGSFQPKLLKIDSIEKVDSSQISYFFPSSTELASLAHQHLVIHGGADDACELIERILDLRTHFSTAQKASMGQLTLVHRRDRLSADESTLEKISSAILNKKLHFISGQITGIERNHGRLAGLEISNYDNQTQIVPCEKIFNLNGLTPKLGAILEWGLTFDRHQICVNPANMQTHLRGIFAVGDIATYDNKKKLILCGFHEATQAAYAGAAFIFGATPPVRYTTTNKFLSAKLRDLR